MVRITNTHNGNISVREDWLEQAMRTKYRAHKSTGTTRIYENASGHIIIVTEA